MKKPTEKLVEAGVIPKEAVAEMVKWGTNVEEDLLKKAGNHPVSLENASEAERLASQIEKGLEKENSTIRETEYYPPIHYVDVYVKVGKFWGLHAVKAGIDALGRYHIDLPFGKPNTKATAISQEFSGKNPSIVVEQELRYEGEVAKTLILTIEE